MGKLGNLAYKIGISLNKEDIGNHRQGITPTAQTLQNLSTDEQLAITQDNQAILDGNKEQLEGEMESGDGMYNMPGVALGVGKTQQKDCRKAGVSPNDCSAYIWARSVSRAKNIASVLVPTSPEEVAFMVATAGGGYVLKVAGKAGVKVIRSFKSKKELDEAVEQAQRAKIDDVKIENLSKPLSVNTQNHILQRHGYDNVLMQIRTLEKKGKSKQEAFKMLDIENRTFFNKNWSNEKIMKATEYAKQDAIKNGVTSGNHTITYHGEKITINISKDGKVSTAFGHRKYGINDF